MSDINSQFANLNYQLPPNWSLVKLCDVCEILDNKRVPINSEEREKRILGKPIEKLFPYYGATGQVGLIDSYLLDGEFVLLGEDGAPFLEKKKSKAYIVSGKIWVNNHVHILLSKNNNKFLCYYLNHIDYHPYVTGTTRLKLNQTSMKNIPVLNPPLPIQHKIVEKIEELFSELDSGVANLRKAKEQIKTYRQSVLAYAFAGKLTQELRMENGELRAEENSQFAIRNLSAVRHDSQLPTSWKWVKLGEVCEDVEMVSMKEKNKKEEFVYYDIGGINNKSNAIESYKNLSWSEAPSRARQIVKKGDVLFSTVRTYLKNIALIKYDFKIQIASTGFCVIRPNDYLVSEYIFYYSLSKNFLEPLNDLQTGSSYPAVRDNDVFNQLIPLAPLNQQRRIVSEIERRLSVVDKLEQTINESLEKAEQLKQSILKKAFEGRLV